MANRSKWAHWNRPKPEKNPVMKWVVGVSSLVLGILLFWAGMQGTRDHVLWFYHFSERWGSMVVSPTFSLFIIGGVFIFAGLVVLIARD